MTTMIREIYEALKEAGASEEKATARLPRCYSLSFCIGETRAISPRKVTFANWEAVSTSSKAVYESSKLASGERSEACGKRFGTWTNAWP